MSDVKSTFLRLWYHIIKIIDDTKRWVTGGPSLKRSQITPNLFLGGQYYKRGLRIFQHVGITAIVNMRETSVPSYLDEKVYKSLHLPTIDWTPPTIEQLQTGVDFIQTEIDKGGKVYVHCHWGVGRGPSMVIAYLISTGMNFDDAYSLVRQVRPFIMPTEAQIARLREFQGNS